MEAVLVLLGILAVIGIAYTAYRRKSARLIERALVSAGRQLGFKLACQGGEQLRLHGEIDGIRLEALSYLQEYDESMWDRQSFAYAARFQYPLPAEVAIKRRLVPGVGGGLDTGDMPFDDTVKITTRDEETMRAWLTEDRRRAITTLMASYPGVTITESGIDWRDSGLPPHAGHVCRVIRYLARSALKLQGAGATNTLGRADELPPQSAQHTSS